MRNISTFCFGLALVLGSNIATAQPAGITMDMINTTLPLEGAPLAVAGPYQVTSEGAFNAAGLLLFVAGYHLFDAVQAVTVSVLRGYKRTVVPMLIYGVGLWCVGLTGGYLLALTALHSLISANKKG